VRIEGCGVLCYTAEGIGNQGCCKGGAMNYQPFRSIRFLMLVLALGALACDMSDVAALFGGGGKPQVVITSPPSGSQYQEGQDVAVQSTATDSQGITRVELVVDGITVRTDPLPNPQPQFAVIQTWKAIQGTHTLIVRAYNTSNVQSDPVAISVAVLPSISQGPGATSPPSTAAPAVTVTSGAPGPCTNDSAFVADVTVPDGTVLAAGQTFNKIWRLRNPGLCTWGAGYDFAFVGGESMGTTTVIAVPNTASGATADLLVAMTAPAAAGTHTGQWRLRANGVPFGVTVNVSINVQPSVPACPGPPVIQSFSASPNPITAGSSTTLNWGAVSNATSAAIDHGIGGVATPGSTSVSPATTTTYTLTATGCGGTATSQVTVTVNPAPVPPTRTPSAVTHKTGPLNIVQTFTADLDEGDYPGGANADIWFEAVTATERYVTPRNGATIVKYGSSAPTVYSCAAAALSGSRINVNDLPVGTYVCVKTNQGRYSEFRVNSGPGPSPGTLGIGFTTWDLIP
jgi:Ig-like domain-containing protein/Big-like domain-containing protein